MVALKLEADFAHAFGALSRLHFVRFLAFGGGLGTHLLVELLLAALALLFETFIDIDGATLWNVSSVVVALSVRTVVIIAPELAEFAQRKSGARKGGSVR